MADTDIKIKLTADPKPVRDAIKLIDKDLKELGGPVLGNDSQVPPTPPDNQGNTDGQTSPTTNSDRVNQSRRDRTNRLILRELTALRRELQKSNQNRTSPPPTGSPPGPNPPPSGGPNPPPPPPSGNGGGGPGGGSDNGSPTGDNSSKIVDAIGKLSSLWSLAGIANNWSQKSYNREQLAVKTYGSLLAYDDYNLAGRDAYKAGVGYGYGYEDVMRAQKANMRYAGFHNLKALGTDTEAILSTSAAYGLDTNQVATVSGRMTGFGTFKIGEQQKFANMLAQSIQQYGMHGREDQELQVLQNISENIASRNTTVTEDMLRSGVNLYGALASVNPNLRGERGGNLTERMMDLANSDDKALDVAAGLGTKYTGISGYLELKRLKETDPQAYFQQAYAGLQEQFKGVDPERIDEMFQYKLVRGSGFSVSQADDMLKAIKSGGTFDLDRDTSAGEERRDKQLENVASDKSYWSKTQYDINKANAQEEIGNAINNILAPFKGVFNNMSQGGQIATTAAMTAIPAIGGGLLMSKLGGLATSGLSEILGGAGGAGGGLSSLFGGINAANAGKLVTGAKIGGSLITGGIAAYNTYDNIQKGDYRGASESAGGGIGAIGGGIKGATAGAAIGTAIAGPIGTAIGGLVGLIGGGLIGHFLGEGAGGLAYDILGGGDEDKHRPEEVGQKNPLTSPEKPYNKGVQELRRLKETDPQSYYQQVYSNTRTQFEGADPAHVDEMFKYKLVNEQGFTASQADEMMKTIQSPHDRFDTRCMRDFTPRDQAQIVQQTGETPTAVLGTSTYVTGKPQNEMLLAHNPALMESRGGMLTPLQRRESADEENDNRGTLERQFRLMEQDTRSTVDNTKAIQDNTKALEKNNKNSFLERLFGRSKGGKGATPTSTITPVVSPASSVTPVSPSQAGGKFVPSQKGGQQVVAPNPGYKAQLVDTGNYLDDYATYMSDFAKERYGQDIPTAFWRTILRSEQGISNEEDTSYYNNPGGMDYAPYMSKEFGGSYRDIIDNGGAAHRIATFDTIEHGLQAQVDYFLNPETHDWAKEEMELIKQGKIEEAFRIHNEHYIANGKPLEQQGYWGIFHEEFDRGNVRTGDDKRTKPTPKSHAHGNEYVPYDNYPALLHKGERVLTRMEANQLRDLPGIYLPPELQIDENKDSIPTRKQKRAMQEQYQYNTSHTFTGSSSIPEFQSGYSSSLQPDAPTGLELMLSLKSQTDELRNLLYGKDSGYNKITGDETKDVARLKRLAQLRNTSTTDAMIRYYAANGPIPANRSISPQSQPEPTVTSGTTEVLPQDKPKFQPFQWITNLLSILGGGKRLPGIVSSLSGVISGKGGLSSWLSLGTELLGMKYGRKQASNLAALNQNISPLFQMLGVKMPPHRTRYSDPISDLRNKLFNKDGSINLDSGMWTSPGWPQPAKGTHRTSSVKPIPKIGKKPAKQPSEVSTKPSTPPTSITESESGKIPEIPKETPPTTYDELGNRTDIDIPQYNRIEKDDSKQVARAKSEAQLESVSTPPTDVPKDEGNPVVPKDQETNKTSKPEKKKANWLQQSLQYVGMAARVASRFGLMRGKHNKTLSTVGKFLGGLFAGSHALDDFRRQAFNKDGSINLDSGLWTSPGWPQAPKSSTPLTDVPKDEGNPTIPKPTNLVTGKPITKENPIQGLNQPTPPAQVTTGTPPVDTSSTGMNADSINIELTVHVDGKIDGMTEANQGTVVAAMVSQFKQPDWLRGISNGFMRRANR